MIRCGVITVSDKGYRGERQDLSIDAIRSSVTGLGEVIDYKLVPDEMQVITEALVKMCTKDLDIIFTTGGTGLSPRDITPEATQAVIERSVPGIPEAMRSISMKHTNRAMLSRAIAGIRGNTLIINLPGSPKAAKECILGIADVLPHAAETLSGHSGDCAR